MPRGYDFIVVAFRFRERTFRQRTFAEQKTTMFHTSRRKSQPPRALARIIHNPKRKRGTGNKIPRSRVGLRKAVWFQIAFRNVHRTNSLPKQIFKPNEFEL